MKDELCNVILVQDILVFVSSNLLLPSLGMSFNEIVWSSFWLAFVEPFFWLLLERKDGFFFFKAVLLCKAPMSRI